MLVTKLQQYVLPITDVYYNQCVLSLVSDLPKSLTPLQAVHAAAAALETSLPPSPACRECVAVHAAVVAQQSPAIRTHLCTYANAAKSLIFILLTPTLMFKPPSPQRQGAGY